MSNKTVPIDWHIELPSEKIVTIQLRLISLSHYEFLGLQKGLIPQEMHDRWFVYALDNVVFFHRSWTGYCVFQLHFEPVGDGWQSTHVDVCDDEKQYRRSTDEDEIQCVRDLVDFVIQRNTFH